MAALPLSSIHAVFSVLMHVAVEAYWINDVGAFDLPGVSIFEPVVWNFNLLAIDDLLFEYSVVVSDTVAPSWDFHGGQTIEEASSEATEATVTQCCVCFLFVHVLELVADI